MKAGEKIAFISLSNPMDKRSWSGTLYSIFSSLSHSGFDVKWIGPAPQNWRFTLGKILTGLCQKIGGKRFDYRHSFLTSKYLGRWYARQLKTNQYNLIIAPAASNECAFLNTEIPIIYINDTTFQLSLNYHKALSNLLPISAKQGNEIEKRMLEKSSYILVSSEWAKTSVIRDYAISEKKVSVVPFGPNLSNIPNEIIFQMPSEADVLKLLFVGVYWENKGGEYAWNCAKILNEKGIACQLTIVGCTPPEKFKTDFVRIYPFINKNTKEGLEQLTGLFQSHHFLILPTRFDCTPVVFCEASAFGLPSVAAKTGGVAGHIKEGENGFLVDYEDTGKGYADTIEKLWKDKNKYLTLRKSARSTYDSLLNWNSWTKVLNDIISQIT